jgi:hypothetical protein
MPHCHNFEFIFEARRQWLRLRIGCRHLLESARVSRRRRIRHPTSLVWCTMDSTTQKAPTTHSTGSLPSTAPVERGGNDAKEEQRAHAQLCELLGSDDPNRLEACVAIVRQLFNADAAGLHILPSSKQPATAQLEVVCGVPETHQTIQPSIGTGLAKLCFSARAPIVLPEQEIELTYLRHLRPRIIHILMAPIYDDQRQRLGAIWLAQITSAITYSRADTLVLGRVTKDLALALKMRERELQQLTL